MQFRVIAEPVVVPDRPVSWPIEPGLPGDKLGIVYTVRDQIYRRVKMQSPNPAFDWSNFPAAYLNSVVNRIDGHECGGRALLFMYALKMLGIKSRYIGLYSDVTDVVASSTLVHATTEVYLGRWVAIDAHYNISIRDGNGVMVSYLEAQALLLADQPVTYTYDGYEPIEGLTIDHYLEEVYQITLKQLLSYMVVGISVGNPVATPVAASGTWNGIVTYAPGQVPGNQFDAKAMAEGSVYQSLL
jgi:hypothetical protein